MINVANQQKDSKSVLNFYKQAIQLRLKSKYNNTFIYGAFAFKQINHPQLFAYQRTYNDKQIVVICNFSNQLIDNPWYKKKGKCLLNNYESFLPQLQPYQAVYWLRVD